MFITHDLGVVAQSADDVIIMYRGAIVEQAPVRDIFRSPLHPYTKGLLRSVPSITTRSRGRLETIEGAVPRATEVLDGCAFAPRCAQALPVCRTAEPASVEVAPDRKVACFLHHSIVKLSNHAA